MNKWSDIPEELTAIAKFDQKLDQLLKQYSYYQEKENTIRGLQKELQELKQKIGSIEFKSSEARAAEIDNKQRNINEEKTLSYNQGYSDAFIEIHNRMAGNKNG